MHKFWYKKIFSHSYQINTTIITPVTTSTPSSLTISNSTTQLYTHSHTTCYIYTHLKIEQLQTHIFKTQHKGSEQNNQLEEDHHPMDVTEEGLEYRYDYQKGAKETMFEKQLTPSDVGKLNRLVIPKQHAEKHFPPTGRGMLRLSLNTGEKGILLTFEDETGKLWSFRYSYWNSSQSYVLTKGWSRFVKEKQLDAGDTVVFQRQFVYDGYQLFIGWRRCNATVDKVGGAQPCSPSHQPHTGENVQNQLQGGKSKILRLFGVDMECQPDEFEPPARDGSSASSHGDRGLPHQPSYMDTDFPRDDIQD